MTDQSSLTYRMRARVLTKRTHPDAAGLDDGEVTSPIVACRYQVGEPPSDRNTLAFVNIGGIPVALTDGALVSNVIITGTPIKNAELGRITAPSVVIVQRGLWATSQGWPSGSMNTPV